MASPVVYSSVAGKNIAYTNSVQASSPSKSLSPSYGSLPSSSRTSRSSTPSTVVDELPFIFDQYAPLFTSLYEMSQANSAKSAEYASDLRNWQQMMFNLQSDFNSGEAAKNRNWQEMMSNTAHQREVRDLKAAGLNPVLSAMNGNGASVGSGASASVSLPSGAMGNVDTSFSGAFVSFLGSLLSAQTQLAGQALSAQTNQAIADKNNSTSMLIAQMNRDVAEKQIEASLSNANLSYLASLYGADSSRFASVVGSQLGYDASVFASQMSADASMYGSQMSAAASKYGSQMSAAASKYGVDVNSDLMQKYPNNPWRLLSSIGQNVAGAFGYDSIDAAIGSTIDAGTRTVERFLKYHTNLSESKINQIVGKVRHTAVGETFTTSSGFRATRSSSLPRSTWYNKLIKNLQNK